MALTKEDLQAIAQIMDERIEPINKRLDSIDERLDGIDERLDVIEEDVRILKGATNEILEWFDTYQRNDFDKPFPVDEKDAI